MAGLRKILKLYGRMKVGDVMWFWDYVADEPVTESEMPEGSERWKASEKAKWLAVKKQIDASRQRNAEGF